MYPFRSSSPVVDYGNFEIDLERPESRAPTNALSVDESDNNDINDNNSGPGRAAVT